jgi:hypothetical protein
MPEEAISILLVCKGSVRLVSYFHLLQFCSGPYITEYLSCIICSVVQFKMAKQHLQLLVVLVMKNIN